MWIEEISTYSTENLFIHLNPKCGNNSRKALENKMAIWIIMIIMQKNKWINVVSLFSYLLESDPKFIHDLITTNCITNFYSFIQHWSSYLLTNNSPGLSLSFFSIDKENLQLQYHTIIIEVFSLLFCFFFVLFWNKTMLET